MSFGIYGNEEGKYLLSASLFSTGLKLISLGELQSRSLFVKYG